MSVTINGTTGIDTIQDGIVTTAKIAADAVTTPKIAGDAVTTPKIAGDAVTTPKIADTVNLGRRNVILNGNMSLDQRNGGSAVTASTGNYCLDRYRLWNNTDGVFTVQQVTDAPAGFTNSAKITVTTADTSLTSVQQAKFQQRIEGYNVSHFNLGTSDAVNMTLSFWVKSSVTGTFAVGFINQSNNRSYVATYNINTANTWEYKTITAVTGDTTGTWSRTTGTGLNIQWCLGMSSYFHTTAGSWVASESSDTSGAVKLINTLNATWQITGVQLEVGDTATPFEHRSYGEELALCQRYFTKLGAGAGGGAYVRMSVGQCESTTRSNGAVTLPVQMRTTPTMQAQGNYAVFSGSSVVATSDTNINATGSDNQTVSFLFDVASGLTVGRGCVQIANNDTTANLRLDAEL